MTARDGTEDGHNSHRADFFACGEWGEIRPMELLGLFGVLPLIVS